MSEIQNQQIRSIEPIGGADITLGLAQQTVNFDTVLSKPTDLIAFGLAELVTTAPANDPLVAGWLVSVSMTINGTHEVVRNMTRAEYINVIQNLELKEAALIGIGGEMVWKKFEPALPEKTRVQITLIVNTLALATTTPAVTAVARMQMLLYDAQPSLGAQSGKMLTYYQRIAEFPPVVGVVAGNEISADLGVEDKILRYLVIREFNAAALADANIARHEIIYNGSPIARLPDQEAKRQYEVMSDGIAVPVGYKLLKLPGIGWRASKATNLFLRSRVHTTSGTGQINGFQVLVKPFV